MGKTIKAEVLMPVRAVRRKKRGMIGVMRDA
jgi:hypothetical protein